MSAQDYYGQQQGYGYSNQGQQGQQGYNTQAPYSQGQPQHYQQPAQQPVSFPKATEQYPYKRTTC
jgi:hypothetical protein